MIALEESSEDSEYEIEKIIDKRLKNGILEYKVKWLGYDDSHSSWEPLSNLENAKDAIKDYENERKNKKKNFENINEYLKGKIIEKENIKNENEIERKFLLNKIKEEPKNFIKKEINNEKENKKENKNKIKIKKEFKFRKNQLNNIFNKNNNSFKTSSSSFINIKDILTDENNKNEQFKIIQINSICKINDKFHASVLIKTNKGEKKNKILSTDEIAEIEPKKLIKFYEENIRFYD